MSLKWKKSDRKSNDKSSQDSPTLNIYRRHRFSLDSESQLKDSVEESETAQILDDVKVQNLIKSSPLGIGKIDAECFDWSVSDKFNLVKKKLPKKQT